MASFRFRANNKGHEMRTIQIDLYQFEDLSDDAKERAREWFRECIDFYFSDEYLGSIHTFCAHFGASLKEWSIGPWCPLEYIVESDNACFRGKKLKDFNPEYMPTGFCVDCDLWGTFYRVFKRPGNAKGAFGEAIEAGFKAWRDDWESQYDDGQVDDNIIANGFEFTENGERVE